MRPSSTRVATSFLMGSEVWRREASEGHLKSLLGLLHGLYWLHWTLHWSVRGDPFYADHLLFERAYKGMVDEIDTLAEKMVQVYGREAVAVDGHFSVAGAWLAQWGDPDPIGRALGAERDLQKAVKDTYESLKSTGGLSLGMDDFLMSVANAHETNLYLLQQRMGGIMAREGRTSQKRGEPDMGDEGHFFDHPRAREMREFAESKALTNDAGVAQTAFRSGEGDRKLQRAVKNSPLTVAEVLDETPGSGDFSTLSRYLVQTVQPTDPGVPTSRDDIPKHPDIK